ncbi:hypothetical protein G7046_g7508 [Stylonectria norvegica]|nr:hypothetical protein G7046_g7508 [Stylonectria norvegica]
MRCNGGDEVDVDEVRCDAMRRDTTISLDRDRKVDDEVITIHPIPGKVAPAKSGPRSGPFSGDSASSMSVFSACNVTAFSAYYRHDLHQPAPDVEHRTHAAAIWPTGIRWPRASLAPLVLLAARFLCLSGGPAFQTLQEAAPGNLRGPSGSSGNLDLRPTPPCFGPSRRASQLLRAPGLMLLTQLRLAPCLLCSWNLTAPGGLSLWALYEFPDQGAVNPDGTIANANTWRQVQDPVIYPGLYSASGFDMMSILLRVMSRPEQKITLGPVDGSVALILCDLFQPDTPIVYASESFTELTGYSNREVLGKNCRFLQAPPGKDRRSTVRSADKVAIHRIRQAVQTNDEIQLQITNYKKNGKRFTNILTIIPVAWDTPDYRYAVGFQSEKE